MVRCRSSRMALPFHSISFVLESNATRLLCAVQTAIGPTKLIPEFGPFASAARSPAVKGPETIRSDTTRRLTDIDTPYATVELYIHCMGYSVKYVSLRCSHQVFERFILLTAY